MATTWTIDTAHSTVGFSVRHMVFAKTKGRFAKWTASMELEGDDFAHAKVEASIDVDSIDTGEAQRDGHLKAPDFLDAANHPKITFKSTKIEKHGSHVHVTGDLTIRGTTKSIALEVEPTGTGKDPWGNQRAGFSAKTSIDRKDFGLVWNQVLETGGVLVGDKVEIEIEVEGISKTA